MNLQINFLYNANKINTLLFSGDKKLITWLRGYLVVVSGGDAKLQRPPTG